MLTLIMKREDLSTQKVQDIKDCFILFKREEVEFTDGVKYTVNKTIQDIPVGDKETTKATYVNISEYFQGHNVGNYVYDYVYYSNVLIPLLKNRFNLEHDEHCSCGHCHD